MTRGERVIKFIEAFCRVPEGKHVGKKMKLDKFQKKFILEVYDNKNGTLLAILSIARKNGKTVLIAALLLAHIVGPEAVFNSEIVSGTMSKDQAAIVYDRAEKMIMLNEKLASICRTIPSQKIIIGLKLNVKYKALSADKSTSFGLSPVLAILDEIGQVKGPVSKFVDSITTAQGAYDDPLLIAISTQAEEDGDMLSIWIDDAKSSKDKHIVCHVYEAEEDCDVLDSEQWDRANPALGVFRNRKTLKLDAIKASRMPSKENSFRNLYLNQRVMHVSPFVSRSIWQGCGANVVDFGDNIVCAGLDLSSTTDLSALVFVAKVGEKWQIKPFFWIPGEGLKERSRSDRVPYDIWEKKGLLTATPGRAVDYSFIAKCFKDMSEKYNVKALAYDSHRIEDLIRELNAISVKISDRIGLKDFKKMCNDSKSNIVNKPSSDLLLVRHGQGFLEMGQSISLLQQVLLDGKANHGMHPVLTMCASNTVTIEDASENLRFTKKKSTGRIDGMQALAMAAGIAIPMDKVIDKQSGNDGSLL